MSGKILDPLDARPITISLNNNAQHIPAEWPSSCPHDFLFFFLVSVFSVPGNVVVGDITCLRGCAYPSFRDTSQLFPFFFNFCRATHSFLIQSGTSPTSQPFPLIRERLSA